MWPVACTTGTSLCPSATKDRCLPTTVAKGCGREGLLALTQGHLDRDTWQHLETTWDVVTWKEGILALLGRGEGWHQAGHTQDSPETLYMSYNILGVVRNIPI